MPTTRETKEPEQTTLPDLPALADIPEEGDGAAQPPSTALAPVRPEALGKPPAWGVGDSWLAEYERMALRVAGAVSLPKGLTEDSRTHTPYPLSLVSKNVLTIALAGRELNIGFMEALRTIDLIDGQIALRARLKMSLARQAGLIVDKVTETPDSCRIEAHRRDTGEKGEGSFTKADKIQAKLGEKERSAWNTHPKAMYWARASSQLVDRLMPDARGASFHTVEELGEETADAD